MAEKRMFAKTIIDSDAFLDMPMSAQCLYFHLCMRADDDGFLNNPKKIQRTIGASEDDLKILLAKNFLIPFDSGIVVIKHWRIHNYIRSDRYKETAYLEEKSKLALKDNKAYTLNLNEVSSVGIPLGIPSGIPNDYHDIPSDYHDIPSAYRLETQIRLDKSSIDKINIDKGIYDVDENDISSKDTRKKRVNYQEIVDLYNDTCVSFPVLKELSEKTKKAIKARLNKYSIEQISLAFQKAQASDFLKGANQRNWIANFEWIMQDSNMAKILNGNYDNRNGHVNVKNSFQQNNYDFEALEKELIKN